MKINYGIENKLKKEMRIYCLLKKLRRLMYRDMTFFERVGFLLKGKLK